MRNLMWFRADLRVTDNPALARACDAATRGVVAVFIICPKQWKKHDWGAVKVDFVLRTLAALRERLDTLNIPLLVRATPTFAKSASILVKIAREHECDALYYNREYEVNELARDETVQKAFIDEGMEVRPCHDQCIVRPDALRTGKGDFYTVFTPFKRSWMKHLAESGRPEVIGRPKKQASAVTDGDAVPESIEGYERGRSDDIAGMWPAGEKEAKRRLTVFADASIADYKKTRDLPAAAGTSTLSPYLACGAISARQCLDAAVDANRGRLHDGRVGPDTWISELVWRDFYRHVLVGYPRVCRHRPFRLDTEAITWRDDDDGFDAWCDGRTGVPIVDAGMRQLKQTGWMHNRLRMITAMFLTKDLLVDWRRGERHFMQHLVDGDLASNNGGWQWSASTGTDAAPYFRIFNPFSQGSRFDADGTFIRTFVEELRDTDAKALHDPERLTPMERAAIDYPEPIVDHGEARKRAIEAFKALRD